jgi:hypothetical protein
VQAQPLSVQRFIPTKAHIDNPERGYYRYGADISYLSESFLAQVSQEGIRLVYAPNDLSAWRNAPLPQKYLDDLSSGFARVRSAGLKVILRFAYNYPESESSYKNAQDASLSRVKEHITQLTPVIARNADVIAVWQAGFIGAWGEWHTSSNGLTSAANKLQVRDALLAALPSDRSLQVRYPGDLIAWFAAPPTTNDLAEANRPMRARIGMHNDCFLAGSDDVGTYYPTDQSTILRQRAKDTGDVLAFGGETCLPPVKQEARMACSDILAEGAAYKLAYLNRDYYLPFFDNWQKQGCLDQVTSSIGYRIELEQLEYPANAKVGQAVTTVLTLRNSGWARLINDRPIVLRLETASGSLVHAVTLSDRFLRQLSPGRSERLQANFLLPTTLAAGRYRITLSAPDASASLANRAIYAMRFANADQNPEQYWDAARAVMVTGAWINVQ